MPHVNHFVRIAVDRGITVLACLLMFPLAGQAEEPLDFTRDIRPILSNKCFHCHGPDDAERQGGLRLDTKQGAYGTGESGELALKPGQPELSELYRRITSHEEAERMPPASAGPALEPAQIAKIKTWIEQGATYADHWAYRKPVPPELPVVRQRDWPRNPIDHFILARLETQGLSPQPQADRETLIRRLALDITGLPPSAEQVEAFLRDNSPTAYEDLVDRLLEEPSYGEHWARMWLDLARYADSAGYADDPPRTIWAYRDYVIQSFNANKPFDQFTIEQLAGDLLPQPSDEHLIATAFHRNTLTNSEGGTDDEEFRNAAIVDRVNTTFAVWMGTTMTCAQCHNHKFDPISQAEFFQVFAILNNTADADRRDESPFLSYFTPEQKQRKQDWQEELARLKRVLSTPTPELQAVHQAWRTLLQPALQLHTANLTRALANPETPLRIDEERIVSVAAPPANRNYMLHLQAPEGTESRKWTALQLETFPESEGAGRNFVVTRVAAHIEPQGQSAPTARYVRIELPGKGKMLSLAEVQVYSEGLNVAPRGTATQSSTDYNGPAPLAIDGNTSGDYFQEKSTTHTALSDDPWWELALPEATPVQEIVVWNRTDGNTHTRLQNFRVIAMNDAREPVWSQEVAEAPNPSRKFSLSLSRPIPLRQAYADYHQNGFEPAFVLEEREPNKRGWAVGGQTDKPHTLTVIPSQPFALAPEEQLVITLEQQSEHKDHLLRRFQVRLCDDARVSQLAELPADLRPLLARSDAELSPAEQQRLLSHYLTEVAPELASERQRARQLETSLESLKPYTTVPIMQELPADKQRTTRIQLRGNFLSLGDEVQPGLPSAFHAVPSARAAPSRLDLAEWLVDENNPLTPRVIANRYWEKLFGQGLVITSEEFGSQGELPTHPELLDWLATELIRLQWDLKAFVRLLVTSASYRQSSQVNETLLEKDPENRLLSRGPRFRLSAEMVRDQALFVSGLLSRKQLGPPVHPPQPKMGLSAAFGSGIDWKTSEGEDRYRRGIYTTWRRSNPYPSMAAFDAPNREVCTIRRDRTNTPLQAFVTLNDPVYVEAAQALARRMQAHPGELADRVDFGFQLCLVRKPSMRERDRLIELYQATLKSYQNQPAEALKLATEPLGPLPEGSTAPELAAWTLVGNVLLNLDEMLMRP